MTHPAVILERNARLVCVRRFHKDELVLPDFVEDALLRRIRVANGADHAKHTISFHAATMLSM